MDITSYSIALRRAQCPRDILDPSYLSINQFYLRITHIFFTREITAQLHVHERKNFTVKLRIVNYSVERWRKFRRYLRLLRPPRHLRHRVNSCIFAEKKRSLNL